MRNDSSVLLLKQLKEKTKALAKEKGIVIKQTRKQIIITLPNGKRVYYFDWHDLYSFIKRYGD